MKKSNKQNELFNMLAWIGVITFLLMLVGCKPLEMFSHTEKGSDTYCVYKISDVKNTGTNEALKKGDIICLYCAGADKCEFYSNRWIKLYEVSQNPNTGHNVLYTKTDIGISYYLESNDPPTSCTSCPGTNKFELIKN